MQYEVIFYKDSRGFSPVFEFLNELDQKATRNKYDKQLLKKIALYIEILEQSSTRSGLPYTKYIGNGIWELRPNRYRILFFSWKNNQIVLLHTFEKKTKKTPRQEILKAQNEMADWIQNGEHRLSGE